MADHKDIVKKMEDIVDVKVETMPDSLFLKPVRMSFVQNGKPRYWDFVKLHESVSVLVYNTSRNVVVLVKQFRPAVYFNASLSSESTGDNKFNASTSANIDWSKFPATNGITLELCAGILDNPKLSAKEIGKQEVFEECGYDAPLSNFEFVIAYRNGIGASGDKTHIYYAEVTDSMRVNAGGGNIDEGELIQVVEMTIPEIKAYITQESVESPGGFLFAMMWLLQNKIPQLGQHH